jgi:threonine/homoserine/homoserine lactone efflux protein
MLGTHDLLLFAVTVFVLNATPGVDVLLTLTTTLRHGVRGGLAVSAGIIGGCLLHTLAAAFGLAALMAASAAAFTAVKWAGAAYLLWLAIGMGRDALRTLLGGEDPLTAQAAAGSPTAGEALPALFRRGLLTNALNPKVALFFLALLPQFIAADAPSKTWSFLFLGAWFALQSSLFLAALVLLVAPLSRWQPRAQVKAAMQAAGGVLFAGLALRLAKVEAG